MNREIFDTYIETQLAPTLQPDDVVIASCSHRRTGTQHRVGYLAIYCELASGWWPRRASTTLPDVDIV